MIDLTVKTLDSQNHAFSLEDDQITVRGFKEHIAESVAVPADSQRLIYRGRVLQDEKKLNDYDVNGKVIHLVQRAPPQPGQRGNDGSQNQTQGNNQPGQMPDRSQYRFTRHAQMHGNAMYFGAMSVPTEMMEGHGLPLPQLSNSLSNSRLIVARRMFDRANELMDRLDDPSCPLNPPTSENNQPPLAQQVLVQEVETEHEPNGDGRTNSGARLADAAVAAIAAAVSASGGRRFRLMTRNFDDGGETRSTGNSTEEGQAEGQPQEAQPEQQGSTSNSEGQSSSRQAQLPRPPQMADLLERLINIQTRIRPYLERYRLLMQTDPALTPGAGPEGVEENQRIVDGVSECLHYLSHGCHALSDIIVDMGQQPPRNLRCRPIVIQHSAVLQPGIPIQVEAHISLHNGNANNNNAIEDTGDPSNTPLESNEGTTEEAGQPGESENVNQQQPGQQPHPQQTQSPFGAVFNLPSNVEVLMEVNPETNMESASGSEQSQSGENNNNNNNAGRMGAAAGIFPWGSTAPPDFIRNLMQAVAGHMGVQGGINTATISSRNLPFTAVGQQPDVTSHDSGSSNAGQSTQARSNVATHPTTATQTRSTPRPHVFHQQTHPLGVGMSIGQGLDFDPFLPCNSYHVRRTSTTSSSTTNSTQGTRTSQAATSEAQTQTQTATTSTTASSTSSTSTSPTTSPTTSPANLIMSYVQRMLGGRSGQPQTSISINSSNPNLAGSIGNIMQMFDAGNIHVGIIGDRGSNPMSGGLTLADLLESRGITMDLFTSPESGNEGNLLVNLSVLVVQNMTIEGLERLRMGQPEPLAQLRRPLQDFFQYSFPNTTPETLQEQATERLLTQLRPHLQTLLAAEEEASSRIDSRIDICATVESLLRNLIKCILRLLFNNDVDDARFAQELFSIVDQFGMQLFSVLRYFIRGGQAGLEAVVSRFVTNMLDRIHPALRQWMLNVFIVQFRSYTLHVTQPPDSEIVPLLIYKDVPSQAPVVPSVPVQQSSEAQADIEPMETEVVEEKSTFEASLGEDEEPIPKRFPGHEALPSNWVPIIAADRVRQRHELHMQGMANGGVATFSDAYLGGLPSKRRKLIEQQKPRLLVSPTPNNSAISASMERLVREGVARAGVEEVEGAAVAVAVDPGVRRAFGQAIRDCINLYPQRYRTSEFQDPLRFPNATKYFGNQERSPK